MIDPNNKNHPDYWALWENREDEEIDESAWDDPFMDTEEEIIPYGPEDLEE